MPVRKLNPVTAGTRGKIVVTDPSLYKGRPLKALTKSKPSHAGRNNTGRITVRHKGGRGRVQYREMDFHRQSDLSATVERLEYDPNRTAHVALLKYPNGKKSYVIAQEGLKAGSIVHHKPTEQWLPGSTLRLADIPLGSVISCLEFRPGEGAKIARSAGSYCRLMAKDGGYAIVRLKSGETRRFRLECRATIGAVSNSDHALAAFGKAGAKRHLGVRPTVRGVAMNPIDHPHGGGEGKTAAGRHPVSPWGVKTKGFKTRKRNHPQDRWILSRRK